MAMCAPPRSLLAFPPLVLLQFDLESSSPTAGPLFTFEADTFFTLHHINAFETADRRVIFDCLAYANADVLIGPNAFGYLDVMHDPARLAQTTPSDLRRYTLDLAAPPGKQFATYVSVDVRDASGHPRAIETPRTSPAVARAPYCFVYGLSVDAPADATRWSLVKTSVCGVTNGGAKSLSAGALRGGKVPRDAGAASLVWYRARHMPTEPVFVARPGSLAEDDGVVLATVLDGDANESYLIVLDAATMLPIAEVRLADRRGHVVPFSIHGQWRSAA
jgi:torulene dioxygenase